MTTDELKKEAEEYAIDNYENCLYDDLPYVNDRRAREEAYIAGAEPREKRIAELEARCNELFLQTCEQAEKIKELKEKLNFSTQYYKGEKAQDQLTKAKYLISKCIKLLKLYKKTNDLETVEQLENFLKESEVEK